MKRKERIVVVGYGWVGQANALALSAMGYSVSYFDPIETQRHYNENSDLYEEVSRLSKVTEADSAHTVYLVCVGDRVNETGEQDISNIESALRSLQDVAGTVVLRATIVPDKLEKLEFDYYVPEFLHEKTAVTECINPHFVVVGKSNTKKPEPSFLNLWRKQTPRQFEGTPREAAMIKYLSNLWNSTRIAFVNEFGNAIATPDSPSAVSSIHRVVDFVLEGETYQRYGRAFGGHCLPKDTRAFLHWYKDKGSGTKFFRGVLESNAAHEKLSVKHQDIPEWFSAWPTPHMSGLVALREFGYSVKKNMFDPRVFVGRYLGTRFFAVLILLTVTTFFLIK